MKVIGLWAVLLAACGGGSVNDAPEATGHIGASPWDTTSTTNSDAAHATPITKGIDGQRSAVGTVSVGHDNYWSVTIGPNGELLPGLAWVPGADVVVEVTVPGDPNVYEVWGAPVPGDVQGTPAVTAGETVLVKVSLPKGGINAPEQASYQFSVDDASDDDDPS